ncbi:hypothetical protein FRC01_005996 [Tulasnella sp. 417]|nr:hypothetical protein FRC01_005996 [Tulasnella sp. 417]
MLTDGLNSTPSSIFSDVHKLGGHVVPAPARAKASPTLLNITSSEEIPALSFSSTCSQNPAASTVPKSPSPAPTSQAASPATPRPTQADLQSDVEQERAQSLHHLNTASVCLPETNGKNQLAALKPEEQTRVQDHQANHAAGIDSASFSMAKNDYHRQQVKRYGRYFGRGNIWSCLLPTAPLATRASSALAIWAMEDDNQCDHRGGSWLPTQTALPGLTAWALDDGDSSNEDEVSQDEIAGRIMESMGLPPALAPVFGVVPSPVAITEDGASFNQWHVAQTPAVSLTAVVWQVENGELDGQGQPTIAEMKKEPASPYSGSSDELKSLHAGSQPWLVSVRTMPTLVEMDSEGEDVEGGGFARRDQREAVAESKRVGTCSTTRLLDRASVSATRARTLSQGGWDKLKKHEAVPPRPKKVVRPRSPVSILDTTRGVPSLLPAHHPRLSDPAPAKGRRLPLWRELIKKILL